MPLPFLINDDTLGGILSRKPILQNRTGTSSHISSPTSDLELDSSFRSHGDGLGVIIRQRNNRYGRLPLIKLNRNLLRNMSNALPTHKIHEIISSIPSILLGELRALGRSWVLWDSEDELQSLEPLALF